MTPPGKPSYASEPEYTVQGKVTNVFNKPVAHTELILLSKKPAFVADTLTDKNGRFIFKGFLPEDTASFVIQAKNRHGKSANIGITVDEFKPPVFKEPQPIIMPWYVNSDTTLLHSLDNRLAQQQADFRLTGTHILKEVKIKAKKVIKNSKNLNGPGGADEVLDEKDMEKAGKLTLLQILQQKNISGFSDANHTFRLHSNLLFFIIDGINIDYFLPNVSDEERYQYLKTILDNITAEDITGIEAMSNYSKYIKYDLKFYPELVRMVGDPNYAYIEVSTRSGNGAFMKQLPGIYAYRPLAVSLPKHFYSPKYHVGGKPALLPDLRSTLYWQPNIITDAMGQATLSFYSADKPSTYTIIVEGTDLNGRVGFAYGKISVK